jgi:hypothetical protein
MECLGWEHPNIEVERLDELGGKADYILGQPPKAVIEAKREAVLFNALPVGKPTVVRQLQPLLRASKEFEKAVTQVIPYCALRGAGIAIVCNGPQLAVFQAVAVGYAPLEGECYLFNGFQSYLDNFPLLWSLLSPEGIAENRAYRDLALHRNPRIPPKAATAILEPLKYRYRTRLQDNLQSLASILLEDIIDHPDVKSDFYRDCYVPMAANRRHLLLSKKMIAARYRRATESGFSPAPLNAFKPNAITGKLEFNRGVLDAAFASRPLRRNRRRWRRQNFLFRKLI